MTFNVIIEHWISGAITFTTEADCKDLDDCIDHIQVHHPDHTIEQIKEVN